jgi:hypothetical protein
MVKIETLKEDRFVRILRCREGNRIWYQMWLTKEWLWVINKFQLYIEMGEIKVWWLRDLQQYYVFFYEKKGYKTIGVLGREITYKILGELL